MLAGVWLDGVLRAMSGITPNSGIIRRVASGVVFITEGNTAPIQKLQNISPAAREAVSVKSGKVTTFEGGEHPNHQLMASASRRTVPPLRGYA